MLALKEEGTFKWEERYDNENIRDDEWYRLVLTDDKKLLHSMGNNKFPENFNVLEKLMQVVEKKLDVLAEFRHSHTFKLDKEMSCFS